ncbi:MAG: hypothetical protein JNM82_14510 [Rhodocyclaceae bacterium]|nr:hypothetical protein [Rhodocyclaceae bacterium]
MQTKVLLATLLASFSLSALAQATGADTPRIDQRQARQEKRIQQGVQSGSLTPREAARLERGQDRVQALEDKAKADGTVTAKERARLHKAEDRQNRRIHREKHDRQHDFNRDGRPDRPRG